MHSNKRNLTVLLRLCPISNEQKSVRNAPICKLNNEQKRSYFHHSQTKFALQKAAMISFNAGKNLTRNYSPSIYFIHAKKTFLCPVYICIYI